MQCEGDHTTLLRDAYLDIVVLSFKVDKCVTATAGQKTPKSLRQINDTGTPDIRMSSLEEGLVHDPAPIQPEAVVFRQNLAAG
jgi:hypothetical protein